MKKLIAILAASAAMLLCGIKANAQDVILTNDGELIMAVVSEISDSEVVYKAFDNQEGPNYRISAAKVQKIRFANGTEQVFAQPVQQSNVPTAFQAADRTPVYSAESTTRQGYMEYTRGEFEVAGRELYEGEYRNYFNADEFETVNGAMRQRSAGKGLMIAGGATLGAGLILFIPGTILWYDSLKEAPSSPYYYDPAAYAVMCSGAALVSVGGTLMTIGVPLFCIGNSRLSWAADSYNQRNQLALSFGAGRDGAGLFLRF